jgi:hypothetical protein
VLCGNLYPLVRPSAPEIAVGRLATAGLHNTALEIDQIVLYHPIMGTRDDPTKANASLQDVGADARELMHGTRRKGQSPLGIISARLLSQGLLGMNYGRVIAAARSASKLSGANLYVKVKPVELKGNMGADTAALLKTLPQLTRMMPDQEWRNQGCLTACHITV